MSTPQNQKPRPELGQKVRFTNHVVKKFNDDTESKAWNRFETEPVGIALSYGDNVLEGVFVGQRTWSVGYTDYIYDKATFSQEKHYFPIKHRVVWLIAFDPFRNPVAVFPEHCEAVE